MSITGQKGQRLTPRELPTRGEFNGRSVIADFPPRDSTRWHPGDQVPSNSGSRGGAVTLDMDGLVRAGRIVPPHVGSPQAEVFRHMKRQLLKNARSKESAVKRLSLIMVTSSLPREGKTFCAINLALSMAAEIDTSVLLVDADVVRPSVMKRLGIHAGKGLLDVLTEPDLDLADVILQTNVPKLSILPAGTRNIMSTELLASAAMESLLMSLATSQPDRVVILDAPPLLVTNEANVLASRVGQILLIVEATRTPRNAVGQALATIEQCPIVMSVLNKAHESTLPYGYGYS
ncbi:MAG: XrtA-associated tyrosine autokinase [Burkholderiales bacterium]|nr:XrtA-associated tyrosine autokinase [Burkholderiales bacterium]